MKIFIDIGHPAHVHYFKNFLAITIGILVLFIGKRLNDVIPVLRNFSIPEPVTGGLLFSRTMQASKHSLASLIHQI